MAAILLVNSLTQNNVLVLNVLYATAYFYYIYFIYSMQWLKTSLTLITNQTVSKSVENLASYGHLKSTCSTNTMFWVSELTVARWPPCADVRLRWPATRTRHLAFIYIYMWLTTSKHWPWEHICSQTPAHSQTWQHTHTHIHTHIHTHNLSMQTEIFQQWYTHTWS